MSQLDSSIHRTLSHSMYRRTLGAALLATLITLPGLAISQSAGPVRLEVVDRATGRALPVYPHRGEWWVEGRPGASYGLRITNQSRQRVLAVMSVDGVNILTGETAAADQAGYVLDPRQSSQINGWRKSSREVAAFHFTSLQNAYATRTGRPNDVGVIGVAVFEEYRHPPPPVIYRDSRGRKAAPAESEAPMAEKSARANSPQLGTGHGRREYSYSETTEFERASHEPRDVLTLRYDSRENLIAMGVIPSRFGAPHRPDAFPSDNRGYVPDPPGQRRW